MSVPPWGAALGALAYLALDIVIHYGHLRHLRNDTGARTAPLLVAIAGRTAPLAAHVVLEGRPALRFRQAEKPTDQ